MTSAFENFVNAELAKRTSTEQDPLTLTPGKLAVSTGVGLSVEFADVASVLRSFPLVSKISTSETSVLDLQTQQAFIIDASVSKTIELVNAPAPASCMYVTIKLKNSGGQITWPAGIYWDDGIEPVLGLNRTLVSLFWDGQEWTGSILSSS